MHLKTAIKLSRAFIREIGLFNGFKVIWLLHFVEARRLHQQPLSQCRYRGRTVGDPLKINGNKTYWRKPQHI